VMLRMTAIWGWNCSGSIRWKLKTSRTDQVSGWLWLMRAMTGTADVAADECGGKPASSRISPTSEVGGGFLPLEPVMAGFGL